MFDLKCLCSSSSSSSSSFFLNYIKVHVGTDRFIEKYCILEFNIFPKNIAIVFAFFCVCVCVQFLSLITCFSIFVTILERFLFALKVVCLERLDWSHNKDEDSSCTCLLECNLLYQIMLHTI